MKKILITISSLFLISCNVTTKDIIVDTSSHGSINMIKIVGEDVLVLNSTRSSIQKIDGDSLITVVDPEITGRDFVLDFILDGEDVFLSNTYDEIFKYKGNVIVDTFKIFSPDKIVKIGEKLYVTSRIDSGILRMIDLKTKKVVSKSLNRTKNEAKFGQTSLFTHSDKVYLLDNSTKILSVINSNLKILKEIYLPSEADYGNFSIIDGHPIILADVKGKLAVFKIEVSMQYSKTGTDIDISSIDLRTSSIDFNKVYLYDYLREKIEIKRWNYEE
ncbi:MAG: hypothetical protein GQ534_06590 [Candidatus Delongbacteria bacterium]|nr:hypothetical protein [Candidatus Delongbacteria bacterium]